ncbi:MAG: cyclopropane-fatty-acyl-phospholipid synthase family protein [Corynebacterium sp.]|nr:cyclopropane-fatty-acyl-phospholipid synthase family protein [Corynebacterium sp.]
MTVAEIIGAITSGPLPFRIEAYDGSSIGEGDITFRLENKDALAYIATAPGDLGLARAYVMGCLTVHGTHPAHPYDAFDDLRKCYDVISFPKLASVPGLLKALKDQDAFRHLPIPVQEQMPGWRKTLHNLNQRRHSKSRDAEAIHHHYDVSNDFYEQFLGDSMTYTCAVYETEDSTLEEAQENKYRLVFDKLRLKEGDRLLDVGCGWGGMVRYAAKHGVKALGVTLSKEQAEWAQAEIKRQGLQDLAEVRFQDYRDVKEEGFDAISSIGILEHIGMKNYESFFTFLYGKLKTGGLMLNHCITRPHNRNQRTGQFIGRYIFPDGELTGSGRIIEIMQNVGFDVIHEEDLRPHYARTLRDWCLNLQENWDKAVEIVGPATARLFGLYMAGSEWGFDHNVVQLHQVLGQKLPEDGTWQLPLRPWWKA